VSSSSLPGVTLSQIQLETQPSGTRLTVILCAASVYGELDSE